MSVKFYNYKLRCLMCFSLLCLLPLLWIYRSEEALQFCTRYYQMIHHLDKSRDPVPPTVPPQCGPGRIVFHGEKVEVNGTKTLLISAYQEHRTGNREVRVIAVVLRTETVAYRCLLCCPGQLHISRGVRYNHYDHFGFKYGTVDIMCPVPSDCEGPSHIAVTDADSAVELNVDFLEVQNQNATSDSFTYNFTVCISTLFDFTNVLQLVQSIEMLKLLGVNRVAIYRTSNSPETQRILDYYTEKGLVEVISWSLSRFVNVSRGWLPQHGPGDLHYFGQIPALNDCLYRYMYKSRYVAQHDIDELILPQSVNSWSELLPLLERAHGAVGCFQFENNVFPKTISLPPPDSRTVPLEKRWQLVPGSNILAHLHQEPIVPKTRYGNFKIIVDPRAVFAVSVHGVLRSQNRCSWVNRGLARMYHTRFASITGAESPRQPDLTPDRLIYDGRLLNYGARLIPAVNAVLTGSGLLPEDNREKDGVASPQH